MFHIYVTLVQSKHCHRFINSDLREMSLGIGFKIMKKEKWLELKWHLELCHLFVGHSGCVGT